MKVPAIAGLVLVSLSLPCMAGIHAEQSVMTYGTGLISCQQWMANTERTDDHLVDLAWVLGFMSGTSGAMAVQGVAMKDVDAQYIETWMFRYCAGNRLSKVVDATRRLVSSLLIRHG
jgi:hypothetical protein